MTTSTYNIQITEDSSYGAAGSLDDYTPYIAWKSTSGAWINGRQCLDDDWGYSYVNWHISGF